MDISTTIEKQCDILARRKDEFADGISNHKLQ